VGAVSNSKVRLRKRFIGDNWFRLHTDACHLETIKRLKISAGIFGQTCEARTLRSPAITTAWKKREQFFIDEINAQICLPLDPVIFIDQAIVFHAM
jgi:hypothetical protein